MNLLKMPPALAKIFSKISVSLPSKKTSISTNLHSKKVTKKQAFQPGQAFIYYFTCSCMAVAGLVLSLVLVKYAKVAFSKTATHFQNKPRLPAQNEEPSEVIHYYTESEEEDADSQVNTEEEDSDEAGHAVKDDSEPSTEGEQVGLGASPFPKAIRERQDGVVEEGHDLVDPDIETTRSLASYLKEDLKIERERRFVSTDEFLAGTQSHGEGGTAYVQMALTFEVNSLEVQTDLLGRLTEVKSLVAALIGNFSKQELLSEEGKFKLKEKIQSEVNHLLKNGSTEHSVVSDVLLQTFAVL